MTRKRIRVWDLPTRLFHWSMVVVVGGAIATGLIGGNMMIHHQRLGVILVGLIAFRLAWGFFGSHTARFTRFVRGPGAIATYLRGQWRGIGHNPVGALSVLALLGLFGFQAMSGLFANDDIAFEGPLRALVGKATSDWITGVHGGMLWWMAALIGLHVGAVLFYVHAKKDNLVRPMITGWKEVDDPSVEAPRAGSLPAFVLALAVGIGAAWIAAGALLPPLPPPAEPASVPAW